MKTKYSPSDMMDRSDFYLLIKDIKNKNVVKHKMYSST